MLTIGAPHSSDARTQSSTERFFFRIETGYWILPHPVQDRLQRKSGSSISTSGYRWRWARRCFRTYLDTATICATGIPIDPPFAPPMHRQLGRPTTEDRLSARHTPQIRRNARHTPQAPPDAPVLQHGMHELPGRSAEASFYRTRAVGLSDFPSAGSTNRQEGRRTASGARIGRLR